jgi:hypothetical protein
MYQIIHENINVAGVFSNHRFNPRKFEWKRREYPIHKISSIHDLRDGGVKKRRYAVLSAGNLYLLEYNLDQETWILEQIWLEG